MPYKKMSGHAHSPPLSGRYEKCREAALLGFGIIEGPFFARLVQTCLENGKRTFFLKTVRNVFS